VRACVRANARVIQLKSVGLVDHTTFNHVKHSAARKHL
jgi:hypothetical protein